MADRDCGSRCDKICVRTSEHKENNVTTLTERVQLLEQNLDDIGKLFTTFYSHVASMHSECSDEALYHDARDNLREGRVEG